MRTRPPNDIWQWPSVEIDRAKLLADHAAVVKSGVSYGLGAKPPITGGVGSFTKADCSGYVRWLLHRQGVQLVDGSVRQHDQIRRADFKTSDVASGKLRDHVLRIAFLRPQDSTSNVGHVALILNGETIESHGSKGPNRRPWTGTGWQAKAGVYALTVPGER
jgi:cell wall-associated NlpC family hydrolase